MPGEGGEPPRPDVVVIAAGRHESGLITKTLCQVKSKHAAIGREGTVQIFGACGVRNPRGDYWEITLSAQLRRLIRAATRSENQDGG